MRDKDKYFQSILEAAEWTLDVIRSHVAEREVNSRLPSETVTALREPFC